MIRSRHPGRVRLAQRLMPTTPSPKVISFSANQVDLLLRTLRAHNAYLRAAHEDARNSIRYGLRPGYVLDFDLLYRYMFEYSKYPNWPHELDYLLSRADTQYIIGPGTQLEIDALMRRFRRRGPSTISRLDADATLLGLDRLDALLSLPNVQIDTPPDVDQEAYELVKGALDRTRRRKQDANRADALNWAAVVALRRRAVTESLDYLPYLLTGTPPLLVEEPWDPAFELPVSRAPEAAIYSEVLCDLFPEASSALRHTVDMALAGAAAQHSLYSSPAYVSLFGFEEEPDWERAVADDRVTPVLRQQLNALAPFVNDPVVYEAQRLYDTAHLGTVSFAQRRSDTNAQSPRRLFDLISGINAALSAADQSTGGLRSLWRTVLRFDPVAYASYTAFRLLDSDASVVKSPYLTVEVHPASAGAELPTYIMRWFTSVDASTLVDSCSALFSRRKITQASLVVGGAAGTFEFEAELPINLAEIGEAVSDCADREEAMGRFERRLGDRSDIPESYAELAARIGDQSSTLVSPWESRSDVSWLRLNSSELDVYADLVAPLPREPALGVFTRDPVATDVVGMYCGTSARYLFAAWLCEALAHMVDRVERGHLPSFPSPAVS